MAAQTRTLGFPARTAFGLKRLWSSGHSRPLPGSHSKTGKRRSVLNLLRLQALVLLAVSTSTGLQAHEHRLEQPQGIILLEVEGQIERTNRDGRAALDRAMLEQLPAAKLETTTLVTDGLKSFDGFYMRDLLDLLGAEGTVARASALNDYVIDIRSEEHTSELQSRGHLVCRLLP